jgi:hypothetical protein
MDPACSALLTVELETGAVGFATLARQHGGLIRLEQRRVAATPGLRGITSVTRDTPRDTQLRSLEAIVGLHRVAWFQMLRTGDPPRNIADTARKRSAVAEMGARDCGDRVRAARRLTQDTSGRFSGSHCQAD